MLSDEEVGAVERVGGARRRVVVLNRNGSARESLKNPSAADEVAERHQQRLVRLVRVVVGDEHVERLEGLAGREVERAARGRVVTARRGVAVGRRVIDVDVHRAVSRTGDGHVDCAHVLGEDGGRKAEANFRRRQGRRSGERGAVVHERVDVAAAVARHVDVPRLVLAEGGDLNRRVEQQVVLPRARIVLQRPDAAGAEVAVEVATQHPRVSACAVDVAARHGAVPPRVVVLKDGQRQPRRVARGGVRVEAVRALHDAPAVVLAAAAQRGLEVYLLPCALPHVGDEEVEGRAVEREAPRVAHAERPDFGAEARGREEGVRRRRGVRVGPPRLRVDAQNLAEQFRRVLRAVAGVAA